VASLVSPVFLTGAQDLVLRLEKLTSREARALCAEARDFVETFNRWLTQKPPDDVRVATINQFLDLNRRGNEFLARETTPASGKGKG
jgi:hypothetical protein